MYLSGKCPLHLLYHNFPQLTIFFSCFIRYICGIEIYRFDLALNSGLLNRWTAKEALTLAGLCKSTTQSEPAPTMAIDAASLVTENGEDPLNSFEGSTPVAGPAFEVIEKPAGYLNRGLLNEDEALKLILAGVSAANFSGSSSSTQSPIGTPKSPTPYLFKAQPAKPVRSEIVAPKRSSTPASGKFDSQSDQHRSPSSDQVVPDCSSIANEDVSVDSNENEKTYASAESSSNPFFDKSDDSGEEKVHKTQINDDHDNQSSDDDEYFDIYHRRKSSSCDKDSEEGDQRSVVDEPVDPKDDIIDESENDAAKSIFTTRTKRASLGMASSKSSSSGSSITLAVPYLAGFIDSWHPFGIGRYFDTPPKHEQEIKCGFSLKPNVQIGTLSEEDSQRLMLIFDQVVCEVGLDAQDYECAQCTRAIGTIFGPAKLCAYTKLYYCEDCHLDETSTIPARIMYNWDFRQLRVCKKAKLFLNAVMIEPIIDVKSFNGELFNFAPNLKEVFELRKQLRYMDAYLSTCSDGRSPVKAAFRKMLWPRLYLYEDVDMCAMKDLEEINNGKLVSLLSNAVKFAKSHIMSCILCSGKGFICNVCFDDEVIYPFDLDAIMQCNKCFTVFHLDCSVKMENCPKCDRIEARNLNFHISLAKSQRGVVDVPVS